MAGTKLPFPSGASTVNPEKLYRRQFDEQQIGQAGISRRSLDDNSQAIQLPFVDFMAPFAYYFAMVLVLLVICFVVLLILSAAVDCCVFGRKTGDYAGDHVVKKEDTLPQPG